MFYIIDFNLSEYERVLAILKKDCQLEEIYSNK